MSLKGLLIGIFVGISICFTVTYILYFTPLEQQINVLSEIKKALQIQIVDKDIEIDNLKTHVNELQDEISRKELNINALIDQVNSSLTQISILQSNITERDNRISDLE